MYVFCIHVDIVIIIQHTQVRTSLSAIYVCTYNPYHKKNIKRTVNRTRGKYIFHLTGYLLGPGSEGWDHMDVSLEPSAFPC